MPSWILKTTRGFYGTSEWETFKAEQVVAIGWRDIKISNPAAATDSEMMEALRSAYPEERPEYCLGVFRRFIDDMNENDLVLLCRGYSANQKKDVYVYGLARVTGPFFCTADDGHSWRFKRKAKVQTIERHVPRADIAQDLRKGTLLQTLHSSTNEDLHKLARTMDVTITV